MTNHDQLPDIATAKLPAAYTVAKRALAECGKVDECKDWVERLRSLALMQDNQKMNRYLRPQCVSRRGLSGGVGSC
jgi:hypothetical protein